ncbi:MAG: hypothetical protein VX424_21415 [Actinomycetota bacterium]|nr:hypothetical protein [Actinomycetota bacterium]
MGGVPTAARLVAASLMVAGWIASTVVASADPDDTPGPAPGPGPGSPAPAAAPSPGAPPPAPAGPKTSIDKDGIYAVGSDIAPGIYSSGGPAGDGTCYWKRTNPDGGIIDNAMSKKPQVVQIDPGDKAFKTSGCQPWQLTPGAALPATSPPAGVQGTLGILNSLLGGGAQRAPSASPAPQAPAVSPAPQAPAGSRAPQAPTAPATSQAAHS